MKVLLVFAFVLLAVVAGAAGALIFNTPPPVPIAAALAPSMETSAPVPAPPSAALEDAALSARVDDLAQEVTVLREELARMKEGATRAPAASTAATSAASKQPTDNFADSHRDDILQVVETDRQAKEQQREATRAQREEQAILAHADRVARALGLSASQQKSLADVYTLERQKMAEMRSSAGGGDPAEAPFQFRDQMASLRQWRTDELTARFGSELAQKINDNEAGGFGRARRARPGGDPGAGTPR